MYTILIPNVLFQLLYEACLLVTSNSVLFLKIFIFDIIGTDIFPHQKNIKQNLAPKPSVRIWVSWINNTRERWECQNQTKPA